MLSFRACSAPRLVLAAALLFATAACNTTPEPPAPPKPVVETAPKPVEPSPLALYPELPPPPARNASRFMSPTFMGGDTIRVAALLPLGAKSDDARSVARALRNAAQLALFEFNNPNILMMIYDTGGDPSQAQRQGRTALREGADIIIGPLFSGSVAAVTPAATAQQVPVIAFSTDSRVASRGVYLLSFLPEGDVDRMVDYAMLSGSRRFAGLVPVGDYGERIQGAFRKAVADRGATITELQTFSGSEEAIAAAVKRLAPPVETRMPEAAAPPATSPVAAEGEGAAEAPAAPDPAPIVVKVGEPNYDALLIAEGGDRLRVIAPLLASEHIRETGVPLMGTGVWNDSSLSREPGLTGGWFPAPPLAGQDDFKRRYRNAYGATPPQIASLAYDAMSLAIALSSRPANVRYSEKALTDPDGFVGIDGIFRFTVDGLNERGLAIMELTPTGVRVLDPAPTSFEAAAPGS